MVVYGKVGGVRGKAVEDWADRRANCANTRAAACCAACWAIVCRLDGCRSGPACVDAASRRGKLAENEVAIAETEGAAGRPVEVVCADPTACWFVQLGLWLRRRTQGGEVAGSEGDPAEAIKMPYVGG